VEIERGNVSKAVEGGGRSSLEGTKDGAKAVILDVFEMAEEARLALGKRRKPGESHIDHRRLNHHAIDLSGLYHRQSPSLAREPG
ncbi:hypothetical protein KEM55_001339, partial [Ascosphaera atra]